MVVSLGVPIFRVFTVHCIEFINRLILNMGFINRGVLNIR